jgi:hypothetical protein
MVQGRERKKWLCVIYGGLGNKKLELLILLIVKIDKFSRSRRDFAQTAMS